MSMLALSHRRPPDPLAACAVLAHVRRGSDRHPPYRALCELPRRFRAPPFPALDSVKPCEADGPRGNVTSRCTVNGLNQVTQTGAVPLSYDARGNLTGWGGDSY